MLHALGTRLVIGLAIAAALGLADVVGAFAPPPDVGAGTPWFVTALTAVAGMATLVGCGLAVRGTSGDHERSGRIALWLVVASRAVSVLAAAPTVFLTGFTVPLAVWSVVIVVVTVVVIVLLVPAALGENAAAR